MAARFGSWRRFLARRKSSIRRNPGYSTSLRPKLSLECLEERRLLSVTSVKLNSQTAVLAILIEVREVMRDAERWAKTI